MSLAIHGITKVNHLTNSRKRDPGISPNTKALGMITLEIKKMQKLVTVANKKSSVLSNSNKKMTNMILYYMSFLRY